LKGPKSEIRNGSASGASVLVIGASDFGFVSDFEIRISNLGLIPLGIMHEMGDSV
jgi:hypothetical protein